MSAERTTVGPGPVDPTRRERLRRVAREAMGITAGKSVGLRSGIAESGTSWYPLIGLGTLVVVDEWYSYAFQVLGPEISQGLGLSKTQLAMVVAIKTLVVMLVSLPLAAFVQRVPRRALVSILSAFGVAVLTAASAFVINIWGLVAVMVLSGAANASTRSVHVPLLFDSYPPRIRVRALSFYRGADSVGNILGPLLVAGLTLAFAFTWRGIFLAMGGVALLVAIFSLRLRDPGFGRFDTTEARRSVRAEGGLESGSNAEGDALELGFFEIAQRVMLIPTIRRLLGAWAVLGMALVPLYTYTFFFLEERWGMDAAQRGLFFATTPLVALAALAFFARRGDAIFQASPPRLVRLVAVVLAAGVVLLALGIFSPIFAGMFVLFALSFALLAVAGPPLSMVTLSLVPPAMRPHVSALNGIFLAGVGGLGGLLLLGGIDRRFGTGGAIASIAVPGVLAAVWLWLAAGDVEADIDQMLDALVDEEQLAEMRHQGIRSKMLVCRNLDFYYGQIQVLFGVDFSVDDGEMVALLGTNGAGKSTLLRVISGLGLPSRGSVHFDSGDITYVGPERRVGLGIVQVPGGRAVIDPLSVVENMEIFGHTLGRDRARLSAAIDEALELFPALADKRNQRASTLSGGEQQMLAVSKALILKPRLLLIDELSLGLAPAVVSDLLTMVRRIHSAGTSVVLVEQSVNVALSLVEHAYFMEKGEIRFDGAATQLLERPDLLRSVFLAGAAGPGPAPTTTPN